MCLSILWGGWESVRSKVSKQFLRHWALRRISEIHGRPWLKLWCDMRLRCALRRRDLSTGNICSGWWNKCCSISWHSGTVAPFRSPILTLSFRRFYFWRRCTSVFLEQFLGTIVLCGSLELFYGAIALLLLVLQLSLNCGNTIVIVCLQTKSDQMYTSKVLVKFFIDLAGPLTQEAPQQPLYIPSPPIVASLRRGKG